MLFLLFVLSLFSFGGSPGDDVDMSITVSAVKGITIFVDKPVIIGGGETYQSSELELLITSFATTHKATFVKDPRIINSIYNASTAKIINNECNWLYSPIECATSDYMYVLKTQVVINPVRAYVTVTLHDHRMNAVSSATVSNKHQRSVIQLTKQKQSQGLLGNTTTTTEEQMPEIFSIEPYLYEKDFRQAVILMYSSFRFK
jgi:hypothetical protein